VFAVASGDEAIRAARAVSALLFASAAFPAYLLARELHVSRWAAVAAGVLSVAAPWLALTTVLFTENLAYPVFLWAVWLMVRSLRAPGLVPDLLAVVAIGAATFTRTQLGCLAIAYGALIAVRVLRGRRAGTAWAPREVVRRFPVTAGIVALGVLAVLGVGLVGGGFDYLLDRVLGPYRGITERDAAPSDVSVALVAEVGALALGVGVLPAVLAAAWFSGVLGRPREAVWLPALVVVMSVGAVWATAVLAQGGFLGESTEERYFMYAAPFLWIGAVAATERQAFDRRTLVLASLPFLVVLAVLPLVVGLNPETQFLSPVLGSARNAGERLLGDSGLGVHDLLVLLGAALVVACAVVWRRRPRAVLGALAASVVVQLLLTVYVFAAARGDVPDVAARTGDRQDQLAWIDQAQGDRATTLVRGGRVGGRELELSFWNGSLDTLANPPGEAAGVSPYPTFLFATSKAEPQPDGAVDLPTVSDRAVQDAQSSMLQLAGRTLRRSPGGPFELFEPSRPLRVRWAAGLDPDGGVSRIVPVVATAPTGRGVTVDLEVVVPAANAATSVRFELGDQARDLALPAEPEPKPRRLALTVCGPATGRLLPVATAVVDNRRVAVRVLRAEVRAAPDACS
jgi:hypothetical protein